LAKDFYNISLFNYFYHGLFNNVIFGIVEGCGEIA